MLSLNKIAFHLLLDSHYREITRDEELLLQLWVCGSSENAIRMAEYGDPDWVNYFIDIMAPSPSVELLATMQAIIERERNWSPFDVKKNALKVLGPDPDDNTK